MTATARTLLIGAALACLTAISFLWFPGHTILISDTQIYIPILEHIENPTVLVNDPMAVRPHVGFTIYDEVVLGLRRLTGLSFEAILSIQQILWRFAGITGIFLIAEAAGLSPLLGLAVAALVSLGATVNGPAVLSVEYEPVPRGFALPLAILSVGLVTTGRRTFAAFAAALAFAYHPPTALPFWLIFAGVSCFRRRWLEVGILCCGPLLVVASVISQPSSASHAALLGRIDPALEAIQRMRTSYNWVDTWIRDYWPHYLILIAAVGIATWRVRKLLELGLRIYFYWLPVLGILSVPLSWLLLEKLEWIIGPQLQPGRYVLFITFFAVLSCAIAGMRARQVGRTVEAALFLLIPFAVPLQPDLLRLTLTQLLLMAGLALAAALIRFPAGALAGALLAFVLYPTAGKVVNYPVVDTPELAALIRWAKESTPSDAIFQFADVRRGLEPGILRARAERAIYADWKAGGQVNFSPEFARLWAERWKNIERPQPLARYRDLGVDYVVFRPARAPKNVVPVFSNTGWVVFHISQAPPERARRID